MEDSVEFKELIDKLSLNQDSQSIAMESQLSLLELQEEVFSNFLQGLENLLPTSTPDYLEINAQRNDRLKEHLELQNLRYGDDVVEGDSTNLDRLSNILGAAATLFAFDSNSDDSYQAEMIKIANTSKNIQIEIAKNVHALIPSPEDIREEQIYRQKLLDAQGNTLTSPEPAKEDKPVEDKGRDTNKFGGWLDKVLGTGGATTIGAVLKRGGLVALGAAAISMLVKDVFDIGFALFKGDEVAKEDIGGAIGSVIGGGVGFMVGGPLGAAIGSMIGNWLGGIFGGWFDNADKRLDDKLANQEVEAQTRLDQAQKDLDEGKITESEFNTINTRETDIIETSKENSAKIAELRDEEAALEEKVKTAKKARDEAAVPGYYAASAEEQEVVKQAEAELEEFRENKLNPVVEAASRNAGAIESAKYVSTIPSGGDEFGDDMLYVPPVEKPGATTNTASLQEQQDQLNANSGSAAATVINQGDNIDNSSTTNINNGSGSNLTDPTVVGEQRRPKRGGTLAYP